ncbi:piezo-type mechanosensitive ion channel component 1-like isoform X2 [Sycon ciliatum]|uniref:piezo-type mechanosensitive ion channel component 1-like isoform X2 n=1 Tax=Sycon ciliatum TaxID=27933 RepID=UPI0031F64101
MALAILFALLYRWLLPLVLLSAAVVRLNGFSLTYLVLLLLSLLLKSDYRSASPRTLLILLLAVSTGSLLGNAFFQISRSTDYAKDHLQPGDEAERIWRQIGFNQMSAFSAVEVIRHVMPDIVVFLLTVPLIIFIGKLRATSAAAAADEDTDDADASLEAGIRRRDDDVDDDAASGGGDGDDSEQGMPEWFVSVLRTFSNALCVTALLLTSAANPSVLSSVYLLLFIGVGVAWALATRHGAARLHGVKLFTLAYSALHLLALYVYQFDGVQSTSAWNITDYSTVQMLGLTPLVNASHGGPHPWSIVFTKEAKWTWYLSPALIFLLFWVISLDLRFSSKVNAANSSSSSSLSSSQQTAAKAPSRTERSQLLRGSQPTGYGTEPSIVRSRSPRPSSPAAAATDDVDSTGVRISTAAAADPAGDNDDQQRQEHGVVLMLSNGTKALGQFVMKYIYLLALVVMMAWSIAYLSWLACAFLVVACILWVIPNCYKWCLAVSPLLAAYAGALLLLEYICDFDVVTDTWEDWHEMGVRHHHIGFPHVLLKAAGFGILLATVRSHIHVLEEEERRNGTGADRRRGDEHDGGVASAAAYRYSELAVTVAKEYWLLVCYAIFLVVSLVGDVSIFKMIYMLLFLIFFITYQTSGRLWSAVLRPLWWLAVVYSMAVLALIYSYQFVSVRNLWDHVKTSWVHDIGLQHYDQEQLFGQLSLPTIVLITVIIQIRYCHDKTPAGPTATPSPYNASTPSTSPTSPASRSRSPPMDLSLSKSGSALSASTELHTMPSSSGNAGTASAYAPPQPTNAATADDDGGGGDSQRAGDRQRALTPRKQTMSVNNAAFNNSARSTGGGVAGDRLASTASPSSMLPRSAASAAATANLVAGDEAEDRSEDEDDEDESQSGGGCGNDKRSWKDFLLWSVSRVIASVSWLLGLLWRLLELHLNRLVLLIITIVCLNDISAFNIVAFVFVLITLLIPGLRSICYLFFNLWALVSIEAKMAFQLQTFTAEDVSLSHNCSLNNSRFTSLGSWVGVVKTNHLPNYVQGYLWVMVLISLRVVVNRHQRSIKEHYKRALEDSRRSGGAGGSAQSQTVPPPPEGTHLFSNVTRQDADRDLSHALKYLCNHGFELFGVEVTLVICATVVVVRQDVFALLYATNLVVLLLASASGRLQRYFLWPVFCIVVALFLLVQYFLLLGLPPSLCFRPFWETTEAFEGNPDLLHWMYLSVPGHRQNKWFPLADVILFISATIHLHNIRRKRLHGGETEGYTRLGDQYHVPDFTEGETWLDMFKNLIFHHFFWLTLAAMFIAATSRTTILSLCYMILSFVFLWFGGSQLQLPRATLVKRWKWLLAFNVFVIFVKTTLQIWSCAYMSDTHLSNNLGKLFATSCQGGLNIGSATERADQEKDEAGLYLDVLLLAMLLLQLRIFSSQYFGHVVQHLDTIVEFAPDGLRMLLRLQHNRRRARRQAEHANITTIRDRVLALEKEPHAFQTLYGGTIIPEEDLKKRFRGSRASITSDTSGSFSEDDREDMSSVDPMSSLEGAGRRAETPIEELVSAAESEACAEDSSAEGGPRQRKKKSDKADDRSFLRKVIDALNDFLNKSVIYWLDGMSYDYIYVETRLRRLRLLKRLQDQGQSGSEEDIADYCAPPGTILATHVPKSAKKKKNRKRRDNNDDDGGADGDGETNHSSTSASSSTVSAPAAASSLIQAASDDDENERRDGTGRSSTRRSKLGPLSALDFILKKRSLTTRSAATEKLLRNEVAHVIYMPARIGWALYYAILARTDVFCYFLMILDHVVKGQILTLPLPLLVFLWALLDKPRPSPRFWVTVITYVEVIVVIKFMFQSALWPSELNEDPKSPSSFIQLLGIYRVPNFTSATVLDIVLLLALCIHRRMLQLHGLWDFKTQSGHKNNSEEAEAEEEDDDDVDINNAEHESPAAGDGDEADGAGGVRFRLEGKETLKPAAASSKDSLFSRFVRFIRTALDPRRGSGQADFYTAMVLVDFVAFLVSIFGYSSFSESSGGNVVSYITENHIPKMFLVIILLEFLFIIFDRVIYLKKWLLGKLIFQGTLLLIVHVWLFFVMPSITKRPFHDNPVVQAWYFFKCMYFAFSSRQIAAGYPTRILGNFLTKESSVISAVLFLGIQAIPFLLEIRTLLDWACTNTVLSIMYWFKVEDIRANIYVIQCFKDDERRTPRKLGKIIGVGVKIVTGGFGVAALILVLWLPLIIISLVNSTSLPNQPYSGTLSVQLAGYEPMFRFTGEEDFVKNITQSDYDQVKANRSQAALNEISTYTYTDVSHFLIPSRSGSLWAISPPALEALKTELSGSKSFLPIYFHWSFRRRSATGLASDAVSGSTSKFVTDDERAQLLAILTGDAQNVTFKSIFPTFINAPSNGVAKAMSALNRDHPVSIQLALSTYPPGSDAPQRWWSLYSEGKHVITNPGSGSGGGVNATNSVEMIIFSPKIAAPQFSILAGQGIIGLYISLVLVVGQFLRLFFKNISHRIPFDDLPNPDAIHGLVKDIYLVRESGRYGLEERLVGQLFLIYRNSTEMIRLTREKPIAGKVKTE